MSCTAKIGRAALAALALGLAGAPAAHAAQFAMVVGVDDYRDFSPHPAPAGELSDLQGAVNDARRIAGAMRQMRIDLPDERLLIDEKATVKAFLKGWRQMLAQATPGDTLIVTFSGHGGQEKETSEPFDEVTDKRDETIMFHDFDKTDPRKGRLTDDQLRELLTEAAPFNVIWVMDSCHSAGLTRNVNRKAMGLTRNGGFYDNIPLTPIEEEIQPSIGDDGAEDLPHVTQILATATEDRLVTETRFDNKPHGALSWFFAEAITGAADTDGNGAMTRAEIANYLEDRVFAHMNQNQQPRILPRGDAQTVLSFDAAPDPPVDVVLPEITAEPDGPPPGSVAVAFEGARPPGIPDDLTFEVQASPEITFAELAGGKWDVFNHTGDRITTIAGDANQQIARTRALRHIRAAKQAKLPAIGLKSAQDNALNKVGSIVGFNFAPPREDMGFLTLFNVASDGTLQYLHPLKQTGDDPVGAGGFVVRFKVTPPTGADQLVASFCNRPPLDLRRLLETHNGRIVPDDDSLAIALSSGTCQIGMIGLFTEEK